MIQGNHEGDEAFSDIAVQVACKFEMAILFGRNDISTARPMVIPDTYHLFTIQVFFIGSRDATVKKNTGAAPIAVSAIRMVARSTRQIFNIMIGVYVIFNTCQCLLVPVNKAY